MSSQFMQSMAVLEGARGALRVGAVSKGERVGFICDLRVEPDVIYAFFTAAGEIGATPFLCMNFASAKKSIAPRSRQFYATTLGDFTVSRRSRIREARARQ